MELYEIVKKLTGPIRPVGETNTDNDRLFNLHQAIELAEELIKSLIEVANDNKDAYQFSLKRAGDDARVFLEEISDDILNELK